MIVCPPSSAGAVKLTIPAEPAGCETAVGDKGAVAGRPGETPPCTSSAETQYSPLPVQLPSTKTVAEPTQFPSHSECGPVPIALEAVTVNRYQPPFVSPGTAIVVAP